MTEQELTKLTYIANLILKVADGEGWGQADMTRQLAELALRAAGDVHKQWTISDVHNVVLDTQELAQILGALYCEWDKLTDELSDGPSDENPEWDQDGLLQAIRDKQALMAKLVTMKPEYEYLLPPAEQQARYRVG